MVIGYRQYRCFCYGRFKSVERFLLFLSPCPLCLSGEFGHRLGDGSKILDELSVEICEPQELLDVLFVGWRRPLRDTLYLFRIHLNSSLTDNMT
ncbi:hypothetical protein GLOTRDRAFT_51631 [Gloeophyllum trabeum ATCC 11539]|uniref:Uncharacterized protein n=1 Tax=Gloeophyllum trabeum (strain ATCC 11539 / FP-39264 / Madison 617) TaxID=670483 RepID=S7RBI7_GLOTA|nr:uncharacterized protein GLOTRDRAFT_51631 [Gloeophyllum trabeum ATCC 11539]EPQ49764.1 hypothetical protein GLOTRDRAFT_51631 [Gloeophyllum trabeum ATCC 11539]